MRRLVVRVILLTLLSTTLAPPFILAADNGDPLEGLTDTEKGYVTRLKGAYADARQSVSRLEHTIGGEAFGALLGIEASPTEIAGAVAACAGELDGMAPVFLEAPPASMQGLAETNQTVASTLSSAFDPCVGLTVDEGIQHVLDAGRNFLGGLMGVDAAPPDEQQTSFKARIIACMTNEIGRIQGTLDAGEAALDATVQEIRLAQQMGEDFLEAFLSGECFIATAAYGTNSAAEIDVLRGFRDDVLMASPAGRDLVAFYYAASPPAAGFIRRHESVRWLTREVLVDPIVWSVERLERLWRQS